MADNLESSQDSATTGPDIVYPELIISDQNILNVDFLRIFVPKLEEARLQNYKKFNVKFSSEFDVDMFDEWLLFKDNHPYLTHPEPYIQVLHTFLVNNGGLDLNTELAVLVIRLLSATPMLFNDITDIDYEHLINLLFGWAKNGEEPLATYCIISLSAAFMLNYLEISKRIQLIQSLTKILFHRIDILKTVTIAAELQPLTIAAITAYLEDPLNLANDSFDSIQPTLDLILASRDTSIEKYITMPVTSAYVQRFYCFTLLTHMSPLFPKIEIFSDRRFIEILYFYMNPSSCTSEILNVFSIMILYQCIDDPTFSVYFQSTKGIERICSIPGSHLASELVQKILVKISNNPDVLRNVCKYHSHTIDLMMKYMIDIIEQGSVEEIIYNFFSHTILYRKFLTSFESLKGIFVFLEDIKRMPWYEYEYDSDIEPAFSDHKVQRSYLRLMLQAYIAFVSVYIYDSVPPTIQVKSLANGPIYMNEDTMTCYLTHIEQQGGLRTDIPSFDILIDVNYFDVILCAFRCFCCNSVRNLSMDLSKQLLQFFYILSFYNKTKSTFCHEFNHPSYNLEMGASFISTLKYVFELLMDEEFPPDILFLKIMNNILMSCFDSAQSYYNLINEEPSSLNYFLNDDSLNVIDVFLKNEMIKHMFSFTLLTSNPPISMEKITLSMKILLILSANKRVCQILSEQTPYFQDFLPPAINSYMHTDYGSNAFNEFCKYSSILIRRLNKFGNKAYFLPHESMATSIYNANVSFEPNELITLIYNHLTSIGFASTASSLLKEAEEKKVAIRNDTSETSSNYVTPTLTSLAKEYLFQQHNKCVNPLIACPPLSLFSNHECPSSTRTAFFDGSIISCIFNRQIFHTLNKYKISNSIKRYIYSRANILRNTLPADINVEFTSCKMLNDENIAVGTKNGVRVYSTPNYKVFDLYPSSYDITNVSCSHNGKLLLGCGVAISESYTYLWKYDKQTRAQNASLYSIPEAFMSVFSHNDKNIYSITEDLAAKMFDTETGGELGSFSHKDMSSFYYYNTLNSNATDQILLFNGDIFCTKTHKLIHTFERFGNMVSGIFHPNDNEVIIGSELWDLRTFRLIGAYSHLKQIVLERTNSLDLLYGLPVSYNIFPLSMEGYLERWRFTPREYEPFVKFYSTTDFEQLGEINLKKAVRCFDISQDNSKFAAILYESSNSALNTNTMFRVYEIGHSDENMPFEEHSSSSEDDEDIDSSASYGSDYIFPGETEITRNDNVENVVSENNSGYETISETSVD